MNIIKFVQEDPEELRARKISEERANLATELKSRRGTWAEINTDNYPTWMFHNLVIKDSFPELPSHAFEVKIVDGKLYMRANA